MREQCVELPAPIVLKYTIGYNDEGLPYMVDDDTKVGIGTATPAATLDVDDPDSLTDIPLFI